MDQPTSQAFPLLIPDWPLPRGVRSVMTTREGVSENASALCGSLGLHDVARSTAEQARSCLTQQLGLTLSPQWLKQDHGIRAIEASSSGRVEIADASFTRQVGLACAVLTADCLPILISANDASVVAAVHAGWRGLAGGILPAALKALNVPPNRLTVYLGPAICAKHFEVGPEVLEAFLHGSMVTIDDTLVRACFQPSNSKSEHYLADLYQLARIQLRAWGVNHIYGGDYCTSAQQELFYSHRSRRDIGRMASLIWLE